jgi:hypothetical protein
MNGHWCPLKVAAAAAGVTDKTMRRWIAGGWVESRREGPRLLYVLCHSDGPNKGRPITASESIESALDAELRKKGEAA